MANLRLHRRAVLVLIGGFALPLFGGCSSAPPATDASTVTDSSSAVILEIDGSKIAAALLQNGETNDYSTCLNTIKSAISIAKGGLTGDPESAARECTSFSG